MSAKACDTCPAIAGGVQGGAMTANQLVDCTYLKLIKSVRLSVEALGFKGSFVAFALF